MADQFKAYNSYAPRQDNSQGLNIGSGCSEVQSILSKQMHNMDLDVFNRLNKVDGGSTITYTLWDLIKHKFNL